MSQEQPQRPPGHLVAFEFSVFDEGGRCLASNAGGRPRVFEVGADEVLPALERHLVEMAEDESRSIVLAPEEAYGPVRAEAFREFPLESIPAPARQVGRRVVGRAPDGSEEMFDVVEIRETTAVIDMNHPMAGRTLRFELRVLHDGAGRDRPRPARATRERPR